MRRIYNKIIDHTYKVIVKKRYLIQRYKREWSKSNLIVISSSKKKWWQKNQLKSTLPTCQFFLHAFFPSKKFFFLNHIFLHSLLLLKNSMMSFFLLTISFFDICCFFRKKGCINSHSMSFYFPFLQNLQIVQIRIGCFRCSFVSLSFQCWHSTTHNYT